MTAIMARVFRTVVMDWPPPEYHAKKPSINVAIGMIALHLIAGFGIFYMATHGFTNLVASSLTMGSVWLIGGFGIAFYYHRMLTHESFKSWVWLRCFLGACASMLNEGRPIWWCALHAAHHSYPDTDRDPHSTKHGFLWAHCISYIFKYEDPYFYSRVKRLKDDPAVRWQEKYYLAFVGIPFVAPIIAGFVLGGITLAAELFLASFLGFFAGLHLTWSINSVDHLGKLPKLFSWLEKIPLINFIIGQKTKEITPWDRSRNNKLLAIFTFGKGNHQDHHADPSAAYHSGNWDINKWIILILERLRIIWDVKRPKAATAEKKPA